MHFSGGREKNIYERTFSYYIHDVGVTKNTLKNNNHSVEKENCESNEMRSAHTSTTRK